MSNEDHELHFEMGRSSQARVFSWRPNELNPPRLISFAGAIPSKVRQFTRRVHRCRVARAHRDPVLWERLVFKIKAELDSGSASYQGLTQAAGRVTLDDTRHATEHYWLVGTLALVTSPRCASGVITPYPLTASRQFCRPSLTKGRGLTVSAYRR